MANRPPKTAPNRTIASRRKSALLATSLVALALLVPASIFWHMARTAESDAYERRVPVPDFLYQDASGQPVSKFDLEGHITVVATIPPTVNGQEMLKGLTSFIEERLIYDHGTEKSPVRLVALTTAKQVLPPSWRQIVGPIEPGILIPSDASLAKPGLAIIDQGPSLRHWRELEAVDPDFTKLRPMLSRLVINHYMRDYLAKRTFFRRVPKTTEENSSH